MGINSTLKAKIVSGFNIPSTEAMEHDIHHAAKDMTLYADLDYARPVVVSDGTLFVKSTWNWTDILL